MENLMASWSTMVSMFFMHISNPSRSYTPSSRAIGPSYIYMYFLLGKWNDLMPLYGLPDIHILEGTNAHNLLTILIYFWIDGFSVRCAVRTHRSTITVYFIRLPHRTLYLHKQTHFSKSPQPFSKLLIIYVLLFLSHPYHNTVRHCAPPIYMRFIQTQRNYTVIWDSGMLSSGLNKRRCLIVIFADALRYYFFNKYYRVFFLLAHSAVARLVMTFVYWIILAHRPWDKDS